MGTIIVSAAELKKRAEDLMQMNEKLKAIVDDYKYNLESLKQYWESAASEAFYSYAYDDYIQMCNFISSIDNYYIALIAIARKYEMAERRNAEIAGKRTY